MSENCDFAGSLNILENIIMEEKKEQPTKIRVATICAVALLVVALIIGIVMVVIRSRPTESASVKYDEAIRIAKREFGIEKVLWLSGDVDYPSELLPLDDDKNVPSHPILIIGEKGGDEIVVAVSHSKGEESIIVDWRFDYSFSEMVAALNYFGVNYVADVPDDYYGYADRFNLIGLTYEEKRIKSNYGSALYERLDIKAVFTYCNKDESGNARKYLITQENGKLNIYGSTDGDYVIGEGSYELLATKNKAE